MTGWSLHEFVSRAKCMLTFTGAAEGGTLGDRRSGFLISSLILLAENTSASGGAIAMPAAAGDAASDAAPDDDLSAAEDELSETSASCAPRARVKRCVCCCLHCLLLTILVDMTAY